MTRGEVATLTDSYVALLAARGGATPPALLSAFSYNDHVREWIETPAELREQERVLRLWKESTQYARDVPPQRVVSRLEETTAEVEEDDAWDKFFTTHGEAFFKDRHWISCEFPWLGESLGGAPKHVLDLGCGCGNAMMPLLREFGVENLRFHGFDVSLRAVELLRERLVREGLVSAAEVHFGEGAALHPSAKITLRQGDALSPSSYESAHAFDACIIMFVLSALLPGDMARAASACFRAMKPGGRVFVRDYARGDMAQMRFAPNQRLSRGLYQRRDGSTSFFFPLDGLILLFQDAGFELVTGRVVRKTVRNAARGMVMHRLFAQCEFRKPFPSGTIGG